MTLQEPTDIEGLAEERSPQRAAEDAGVRALLACWLRESSGWVLDTTGSRPRIVIPLPRWNAELLVDVARLSATFRDELALPAHLQVGNQQPRPVGLAQLAVLLIDTLATDALADDRPDTAPPSDTMPAGDTVLARVLDSAAAVTDHLTQRAADIDRLYGPGPLSFADTEQALLLGHLTHPTPKSRTDMSPTQQRRYSPEAGARFPLRWLAVHPDLVHHASATATPAPALAERLLRDDPATDTHALNSALAALDGPHVLLPAHPYQADHLATDPDTAGLFDSGAVTDLGTWGSPYLPTTSVRTVYRATAPWQLKFSLHVHVTNSMRVTLPKELDRAVEAAHLARTSIGAHTAAVAPNFTLLHDPAYLTLTHHGHVLNGFSVLFRHNRWAPDGPTDVTAVTTLCQDHPYGGKSRLAAIIDTIATREHRTTTDVAREWFDRFCHVVVRSLIRLYLDIGLCFEAHQQNTLVELDGGWPVHGIYRDSQGYFHREAAHPDLTTTIPGLGETTESIFPEPLATERLTYYLFVNLTLGVVNALGARTDERQLLDDLGRLLANERRQGGRYPTTLLDHLLDNPTWPCKANLRTRIHDMDELTGDIATQSVYVTLANPLRANPLRANPPGEHAS